MPYQRIGTCSICGGNVMGHVGDDWMGINPPGPPECVKCGAVSRLDVIQTTKPKRSKYQVSDNMAEDFKKSAEHVLRKHEDTIVELEKH